jgi:hypothetical protein
MAIHIAWREFIGTLGGLAVTAAATDVHRRADSAKVVV